MLARLPGRRPDDARGRECFAAFADGIARLVDDGRERADRILETAGDDDVGDRLVVVAGVVACGVAAGDEPVGDGRVRRRVVLFGEAEVAAGDAAHAVGWCGCSPACGDGSADPYDDGAGAGS